MKQITFAQTSDLLGRYEIDLIQSRIFVSAKEAWSYVQKSGKPVALKTASTQIDHRTESNAVFLNVKGEKEFFESWEKIVQSVGSQEIIVQEMRSGIEIMMGVKRDSQFGPVILFGLGGILVELLEDISMRIAPFDLNEAEKMIREIKGAKILDGFRGYPKVNEKKLAKMLSALSYLSVEHPEIEEVDLNPIIANGNIIEAVDAKIWIKENG